jgi:tetratricopeptide (TPR) repeat protein
MEKLHSLLHSLNPQQIKVLRKFLTSFSSRNETHTKMWDLAAQILAKKKSPPTIQECSLLIYGVNRDSRIEKLKTRLYSKVLDSLIIDINTNRRDYQDEVHPIFVRLKKRATLFQIIRFTSLRNTVALDMLQEIIQTSKKYEQYPLLLESLTYSKWIIGWREGNKVINQYNKEIDHYEKCNKALNNATDNYYNMISLSNFQGKASAEKLRVFLEDRIAIMTYDYANTQSASVGYYLKLMEMAYFQHIKDYRKAKDAGRELLSIIINNVSVYRKVRLGFAYDNLAETDIYLGDYNSALQNIELAAKNIGKVSRDYIVNRQLAFEAHFHKNEVAKAAEICAELLHSTRSQQGDFRIAKYRFFSACIDFKRGNYKECASELSKKFELSRDKVGWEISTRVLRIMALIELERFDEAQPLVTSLQKHIERTARKSDVDERDRLILRLLREFEKEGFNRDRLSSRAEDLLLQLAEVGKTYSWQPFTPELIPVQEWFMSKYHISKARGERKSKVNRKPKVIKK